jgi:hypothetical protein
VDASTSLPDASTSAPGAYSRINSIVHFFPTPSILTRTRSQPGPCRGLACPHHFLSDDDLRLQTGKKTSRDGLTNVH